MKLRQHAFFYSFPLLFRLLTITTQAEPEAPFNDDRANVRAQLAALTRRHSSIPISLESQDYQLLERLEGNPSAALDAVDELIDLTAVLEDSPATTEKFSVLSRSTAGRVLRAIGPPAQPKIEERLKGSNLGTWQRLVLREVIREITHSTEPPIVLRSQSFERITSSPTQRIDSPERVSPSPASSLPEAASPVPEISPRTAPSEPAKSSPKLWPWVGVLVAAAVLLIWFFRRSAVIDPHAND